MSQTEHKIIVSFHIGRGGRFYNSGHKIYLGEMSFQDLINSRSSNLHIVNRNKQGEFIKATIFDDAGNIASDDDVNSLVGTLNFDEDYDTDIAKYIEDCTSNELELIRISKEYKSEELEEYLRNNI